MSIARLTTQNTSLLVIDVQERLLPEMVGAERLASRCVFSLRLAETLGLPAAITEQYVKGLGPTDPGVRKAAAADVPVFEKTRFSACVDPVRDWLREIRRPNVLICGMEAHVCVLQTGLDLLESGFRVFWVSDAISGGEADQIEPARRRLEAAGAITTGCISMAYELLRDAHHPRFKDVLSLVKPIRK